MPRIRSNSWLNGFTTVPVIVLAAVSWWQIARADAVLDWNTIAADTVSKAVPPRPVPVSFLDMAVVQAAVYDAVEAIGGKFKPYHVQIPGASGSPEAAAAKAAHDVLVDTFPPQVASLDTTYRDYLAKKGLAEDNPGVAVGQKAAAGILALRANDGRLPNPAPPPFIGDNATGVWRPTTSYQPPPPPRSPTVLASQAWDLQANSNGRFVLGLGSQVKGHNERRFGIQWSAPDADDPGLFTGADRPADGAGDNRGRR
jgi:hypothetical protein